jgi:hypothetical protein
MSKYVVPDRVRQAFLRSVDNEYVDLMVVISWLLKQVDDEDLSWVEEGEQK